MRTGDASSQQDYESAEATLAATRADIEALDAQIEQGRISVDTARVNLGYTRIVAPMDGVVVAIVTREGQTVNAVQQAPTIIKLAQLGTMTVKAQISEADVPRVEPGQPVYFTILGEPDHRYHATLRAIEPAPDSITSDTTTTSSTSSSSSSGSSSSAAIYYNGLFDVDNPDGKLRISMTAQVSIVLAEAKGAVTVPATALGKKDGQGHATVRVLDEAGQPVDRAVRVGISDSVSVQIMEGLAAGEQVVVGDAATAKASGDTSSRRPGPPPMGL
jgi:macrolide-specific efflux system membrane fusion protein